jgi:hypothetical protein
MAGIPDVLNMALAAVQSGDAETLHRTIDWPLTGAAKTLNSLPATPARQRAASVAIALAQLDLASTDPSRVADVLADQARLLSQAADIRVALHRERREVLTALRIPPTPTGLTAEQLTSIDALRARAELVTDVYVVITRTTTRQPYAIAPDTGLLVLVLA